MRRDTVLQETVGDEPPATASARQYLRDSLPTVYLESPSHNGDEAFVMRFLAGLEQVLDPIVATLDLLPAHLDVDLAPPEVIALIGKWLGIELDAALPIGAHRRLLRQATEVTRTRGTLPGVKLVLDLSFRGMQLEVRDGGRTTAGMDPDEEPPAGEQTLTVFCPPNVDPDDLAAIRRVVDEVKPAHVAFELVTYEQQERA